MYMPPSVVVVWNAHPTDETVLQPRYNIAPSQYAPIITNTTPDIIVAYKWGLIPHWAKDASIGHKLVNARSETAAEKPSFRESFAEKRCIVLCSGFYEWKGMTAGKKQPYLFTPKNENQVMGLAGLWSEWKSTDGKPLFTFTILTTKPNSLMKQYHDRMPCIITPDQKDDWLQNGSDTLLLPVHDDFLSVRAVSTALNNPRKEEKSVLLPNQAQRTLI